MAASHACNLPVLLEIVKFLFSMVFFLSLSRYLNTLQLYQLTLSASRRPSDDIDWRSRIDSACCMGSGLILSPRCPFLLYVIFGYTVYFVSLVGPCLNRAGLTSFIRNLPIQRLCDNQPTFYISPCVLLESHQPASIFEPHKQRIKQIALFRINLRFCHPFVIWSSYPFNFSTSSQIPPIDQASSCPLFHASCPFPFASPRSPLVR